MDPKPIKEGFLPEQDGHAVYYAQYGNTAGPAVLSLHGGPGSKSKPKHAKLFDLEKVQVIAFDQRGCGKSTPLGGIEHNSTDALVGDIERLRQKIDVEQWFVSGASWGSTLALAYAQAHPSRVRGLLLGAVFLARPIDIEWFLSGNGGIERMFPDVWEARLSALAELSLTLDTARSGLLELLTQGSEAKQREAAATVINWEGNLMSTTQDTSYLHSDDITEEDIAGARIFMHYDLHDFFLTPDQLLKNCELITHIPTAIVHGRYDILCPLDGAWELKKRLKEATLTVLPSSAHQTTAEGEVARRVAFDGALKEWR